MRPKKEVTVLTRDPKKFEDKFRLLVNDPEFQKNISKIREDWGVDLDNKERLIIVEDKRNLTILLRKNNLGDNWEYVINIYILTGKFEPVGDPYGIEFEIFRDKKCANIKIFEDTTLDDIKEAYKIIRKKLKGAKIKRNRRATESERDIFVYELSKQGKTYSEICTIVGENYEVLDANQIARIINKMKKRKKKI